MSSCDSNRSWGGEHDETSKESGRGQIPAQDEYVPDLSIRCCILEHKLQHLFDDRHGLETESAIKVDLVQTKRKKGRGSRNKAAVRNDTKCEQQVLMDAFDDV